MNCVAKSHGRVLELEYYVVPWHRSAIYKQALCRPRLPPYCYISTVVILTICPFHKTKNSSKCCKWIASHPTKNSASAGKFSSLNMSTVVAILGSQNANCRNLGPGNSFKILCPLKIRSWVIMTLKVSTTRHIRISNFVSTR